MIRRPCPALVASTVDARYSPRTSVLEEGVEQLGAERLGEVHLGRLETADALARAADLEHEVLELEVGERQLERPFDLSGRAARDDPIGPALLTPLDAQAELGVGAPGTRLPCPRASSRVALASHRHRIPRSRAAALGRASITLAARVKPARAAAAHDWPPDTLAPKARSTVSPARQHAPAGPRPLPEPRAPTR